MEQRTLGDTGLGRFGAGAGLHGNVGVLRQAATRPNRIATIHRALDLGITLLDTADMYGPFTNEELVGRAIAGRRDKVVLATKFGIVRDPEDRERARHQRPARVRARSAARPASSGSASDHIDLYYQHRVDPATPIEETVGAMAELVEAGKVRYLGLSEAAPRRSRRAHARPPDHRAADRVLALDPRPGGTRCCHRAASSASASSPTARSAAAS